MWETSNHLYNNHVPAAHLFFLVLGSFSVAELLDHVLHLDSSGGKLSTTWRAGWKMQGSMRTLT